MGYTLNSMAAKRVFYFEDDIFGCHCLLRREHPSQSSARMPLSGEPSMSSMMQERIDKSRSRSTSIVGPLRATFKAHYIANSAHTKQRVFSVSPMPRCFIYTARLHFHMGKMSS